MSRSAPLVARAAWRDYLTLTKPKVVSLLLFTAVGAMFMAARGLPPWLPLLGVLVGGYMSTGGAGVFNMVLERDIDARMKRTMHRPLVTGAVSVRNAVLFGALLSAGSFVVLLLTANLLTALLAWFGLLFYVGVYTLWLKRATWQNIVIGGVAGAVLPLLGWAAIENALPPMAWVLFVLIVMWTPVHFWALAFIVKDQYAAVGVPMAPSVLGTRGTLRQMMLYLALTVATAVTPFFLREAGPPYLLAAAALNLLLAWKVWQLYRRFGDAGREAAVDRQSALSVYKYSMLYLALIFLALAVDRMVGSYG